MEQAVMTPKMSSPSRGAGSTSGRFKFGRKGRAAILVVDDENGPRQALRMLLKEDHDVLLAESVAEAIEVLANNTVDVVITDIRMPRQTGMDLLRHVKTKYPDIEVIILTGYGQLDTAMEAIDFGAFAYLEKPFDNETMLEKVGACLEKQKRELERRAMEHLALEANRFETLGRLVSGTMHDLGTPLSVIGTNLDILMSVPDRGDVLKRLSTMRAQVEYCNDLVRTTMNFLRQSPAGHAPFSLNTVMNLCLEVARPQLMSLNVAVAAEFEPELPQVLGDMVLVRQAVLNLIYNACQAMEAQETPRQLRLQTYRTEELLCIAVQDNGPGVPESEMEVIFEALYTTKGNQGTGLGLAVVKNVMERHGGRARLEAHGGRGARFVLEFPIPATNKK